MQLAYERHWTQAVEGKNRPPALVFLHAFPVDGRLWRDQLRSLAGLGDALALDFRGYGRSLPGSEPFSMQLFAQDVLSTLSNLEPPCLPAVFVGCSMGGYTLLEIWRQQPEAVAGMVLVDTRAEADNEETRAKRRDQVAKIQSEGPEFLPRLMTQNLIGPTTREQNPALAEEARGWMSKASAETLTRSLEALAARRDSLPILPSINVPALVIVGEEDTVTPKECAVRLKVGIPDSELVEIPGSGHLSPIEKPAEVTRAIEDWYKRKFC